MKRIILLFLMTITLIAGDLCAEDGVGKDKILLGQSCALTGPARALGNDMKAGMEAYFAKINNQGGIKGREITLISKDDRYDPFQAIRNTRELLETDKVFLLIGEVGTPTSEAVLPIAEKAKVPFFAPFTGAEFLRNPFRKYVINIRASYYQEMEKIAEYLVDKKGLKKIACFYQNDTYGQTGLEGIRRALQKRSLELTGFASYDRNTLAVKNALLTLRKTAPEAIVMAGTYKPCAEFIRNAKKVGMNNVIFCNISFVGTEAFIKELGDSSEGCIISQVVNFPYDDSVPIVREYLEDLKLYSPNTEPGFVSLEGYIAARLCGMIFEKIHPLTRENFIKAIETVKTFDLGGISAEFGESDHQGMDSVFLTIVEQGVIRSLGRGNPP